MTQALLNNLNINIEQPVSELKGTDKGALIDFAQILQGKTQDDTKNNTQNDTQNDTQNEQEANDTNKDLKTLGDIKQQNTVQPENINTVINDAATEAAAEAAIDITLIQETIENTEETTSSETDETDSEDDTQDNNSQEDAITQDEDPTMNKEIIYHQSLENPAAAMMLQSQLQKHSFKDEEQADENSQNNDGALKNNKDVVPSSKQFENSLQKSEKGAVLLDTVDKPSSSKNAAGTKLNDLVSEKIVEDLQIETVETQDSSTENGSNNFMNNQSPQEQAVKAMIHSDGVNNSVSGRIEVLSTVQAQKAPTEVSPSKIIEQITKQMEGMYNGTKVNIVLNPGTLGKVALQILNTKDGLSAQFTVNTPEARDILMKGLTGLRESLLAHGVSVDNVTVKLSETEEGKSYFDWTEQEGSRGGNKQQGSRRQKDDEKQFEQTMFDINNKN